MFRKFTLRNRQNHFCHAAMPVKPGGYDDGRARLRGPGCGWYSAFYECKCLASSNAMRRPHKYFIRRKYMDNMLSFFNFVNKSTWPPFHVSHTLKYASARPGHRRRDLPGLIAMTVCFPSYGCRPLLTM